MTLLMKRLKFNGQIAFYSYCQDMAVMSMSMSYINYDFNYDTNYDNVIMNCVSYLWNDIFPI